MQTSKFMSLMLGLSMGLLTFAGCSGGNSPKSCSVTTNCDKGTICVDGTCASVNCTTSADCTSGICDTAAGVCTPRECTLDTDCNDSTLFCNNGICETKTITPDNSLDAQVTDAPAADGDVTVDNGAPVPGDDCKVCTGDTDCSDGYQCISLSSGKACLKKCENNGDCVSGYICYAASTAGKNCVPPSYKCVECATKGCPDGKVCDLSGGTCVDKVPLCGPCTVDWECGSGNRCYRNDLKSKGICVPECKTNADCPQPQDKYACKADTEGTMICQPSDLGVCCPADKPVMLEDGTCVQCASATDCKTDEACDPTTHTCNASGCPQGQHQCASDNQCHQCCQDTDCTSPQTCQNNKCVGDDPCGGCSDASYPYCVQYQGNSVCAACSPDVADSCKTGCVCDPNNFTCLKQDGTLCIDGGPQTCGCTADTDCVDPNGTLTLKCSSAGFCYDPAGSCDGTAACCDSASGSTCFDVMSLLMGGMGGGLPGMPSMFPACTCDAGDGSGAKCPDGITCTPLSMACVLPLIGQMLCPGGSLPPTAPSGVCADLSNLLGGGGI